MQNNKRALELEEADSASDTTLGGPQQKEQNVGSMKDISAMTMSRGISKAIVWSSLWLFSLIIVLGHFWYYASLNGQPSFHLDYTLKAGNAFAFIYKAILSTAVSMAIVPMIWVTVSEKEFTFSGLNKMFTMDRSPAGLFSQEILRKAHLVTVFGLVMIAISVSAVFPPATMIVVPRDINHEAPCNVPSINMRNATLKDDELQDAGDVAIFTGPVNSTRYDTFEGAAEASSLISLVAYGGGILNINRGKTCDQMNCTSTFSTTFAGPSLKCEKADWKSAESPFRLLTDSTLPRQTFTWVNDTFYTKDGTPLMYMSEQADDRNIWLLWSAYKKDTELARTAAEMKWCSMTSDYPENSCLNGTGSNIETLVSKCTLYNTTYNIDATFFQGFSIVNVNTSASAPYNTTLRTDAAFSKGVSMEERLEVRRSFGLMDTLYHDLLNGQIIAGYEADGRTKTANGIATYGAFTKFVATSLAEDWMIYQENGKNGSFRFPVPNLAASVEKLSHNITVSMLSRKNLVFSTTRQVQCQHTFNTNVYEFDSMTFWASYGSGSLLGFVAVLVGILCMFKSRQFREASFTSIAVTTMDPSLQEFVRQVSEEQQGSGPASHVVKERLAGVRVTFDGGSFKVKEH